jgi:3-methyl-2-oxobutanoate hydroxymethyltransferase
MSPSRIRVPDLKDKKSRGEKIAMLTAYDATMARLLDQGGADALLVGDSVGMVVLGYENTLAVTLEDMLHHSRAVARAASRALVVTDMPFLSYQVSAAEAVRNAGRLLQEGGASAIKLEGGRPVLEAVRRMVDVGIPVMGHLGLQPQSVHQVGGYVKQAVREEDADALVADALALQDAGAFAVVLESIPEEVARTATAALEIPTIGIGAGPHCDGQVLVSYDMLGLFDRFIPSFVKQYANMADTVRTATRAYVDDVRQGRYPQSLSTITGVSNR